MREPQERPALTSTWRSWSVTQVGVAHAMNQDRLVDRPEIGLWAVADGAGGHEHGDIASSMLADALAELPPGLTGADMVAAVRSRVAAIHQLLRTRAELRSAETGAPVTIASTIVLMLASDSYYACLWAGDSRAYRLHEGALIRLTHDHSLVQALVDEGALTEAEAEKHPLSNVITRAIGADVSELTLDKVTDRARSRRSLPAVQRRADEDGGGGGDRGSRRRR